MLIKQKYNIAIALSGGVDSSVVAALLKDSGHNVRGYYYKRGGNILAKYFPGSICPAKQDLEYLEKLKLVLNIPIEVFNLSDEYEKYVFESFVREYKQGRTPNPDVLCNRYIKFGVLLERIKTLYRFDYLATGHYARIGRQNLVFPWDFKSSLGLYGAVDVGKDQVYFLGQVKKSVLRHVTFPLGSLFKSEVRVLAEYYNLPTKVRRESQGICFLGKVKLQNFLLRILGGKPGDIIDMDTGQKVGRHNGVFLYTVGQRKGLNIGGLRAPYYVVKLDIANNIVYVAQGRNNSYLRVRRLQAVNINKMALLSKHKSGLYAIARYRQRYQPVKIKVLADERLEITTKGKGFFWAPAIGQYVNVVYASNASLFGTRSPMLRPEDIFKYIFSLKGQCDFRCYRQILSGKIVRVWYI